MKERIIDGLILALAWIILITGTFAAVVHYIESDQREDQLKRAILLHKLSQQNAVHVYIHEKGQP